MVHTLSVVQQGSTGTCRFEVPKSTRVPNSCGVRVNGSIQDPGSPSAAPRYRPGCSATLAGCTTFARSMNRLRSSCPSPRRLALQTSQHREHDRHRGLGQGLRAIPREGSGQPTPASCSGSRNFHELTSLRVGALSRSIAVPEKPKIARIIAARSLTCL